MRTPAQASAVVALAVVLAWSVVDRAGVATAVNAQSAPAAAVAATDTELQVVCGTSCHKLPPADILPKNAWRDEISRMAFIRMGQNEPAGPPGTASRMIALPPDMQRVLRHYEAVAPASLPSPTAWPTTDTRGFAKRSLAAPNVAETPAISHVRVLDVAGDGKLEIVASDMRYGFILAAPASDASASLRVLTEMEHPSNFALFDLDGDGSKDFLGSELGQFLPSDHTKGAVVWLRRLDRDKYVPLSIPGWPRVADIEAADFNGDKRPDLAVASFGWRKVGRLSILENRTDSYDHPSFTEHVIDPRPGSIHAIPTDLDRDGRLDLVVLFAQQFETVVAFMGTGTPFEFTAREIYTAPHPNWGSSGIELVDLDGDGDLDVLYSHGDTFDDQIIKPYHGIQWLENRGTFPFTEHTLADLPGVFRAQAGDLDGDGDLDIVACAFIAGGSNLEESSMPSLVWLEQVRPAVFERRTLERTAPRHATLDLADIDGDGDVDIVVGNFSTDGRAAPYVDVWENTRPRR